MPSLAEARPPYVVFEQRPVEDRAASEAAGSLVYKDVDYAIITPQGSKDRIERVATEWLVQMKQSAAEDRVPASWVGHFQGLYKAFQDQREAPINGTPLSQWAGISPAQVKSCLQIGVRSVEDLAAANEETIARLGMGGRDLKHRAEHWVGSAQGLATLAEQVKLLQEQNAMLVAQLKELSEISAADKPSVPGRNR